MPTLPDIRFSLQARLTTRDQLFEAAAQAEDIGMHALYVPDHPGVIASPFAVLAAVAARTTTLMLGTNVINAGLHHPIDLANATATLDVISDGRAILGLGAGHTPSEWTSRGLPHPAAAARVDRLEQLLPLVIGLLAGDTVTYPETVEGEGIEHFHLDNATITSPRPVQQHVPLLIGGNGPRVLRLAGRYASIIGFSGLGPTKPDGHSHEAMWLPEQTDASVAHATTSAADRTSRPVREVLVQHVEITDQRADRIDQLATTFDVDPAQLDAAPYVLIGSQQQIIEQLAAQRERWGFTSYVVREPALADTTRIMAAMN